MNKDYYGYPAVTQCRICNKTVWDWQSYERRNFEIVSNDTDTTVYPFVVQCSGSGIVHTKCKGNPKFEIQINRGKK